MELASAKGLRETREHESVFEEDAVGFSPSFVSTRLRRVHRGRDFDQTCRRESEGRRKREREREEAPEGKGERGRRSCMWESRLSGMEISPLSQLHWAAPGPLCGRPVTSGHPEAASCSAHPRITR
jgi:hypothetical protein